MRKTLALLLILTCLATALIIPKVVSGAKTAENTWASKASMHQARGGLGVVAVNDKIYAIGGSSEEGITGINEEYDPITDMWAFKRSMPTPRVGFAIVVYQNRIYCMGGSVNVTTMNPNEGLTKVNEVYNPATDTWETKAAMPTAISSPQADVVNDKIFVVGGNLNAGTLNEVYDPATDKWSFKSPMPEVDFSGSSAVFDNKIYFFVSCTYRGTEISATQIYNQRAILGAKVPRLQRFPSKDLQALRLVLWLHSVSTFFLGVTKIKFMILRLRVGCLALIYL